MSFKDWSTVAASNTTVGGVSIAEGMSPAGVNNAMRAIMADVRTTQGAIVSAPDYPSLADAIAAAGAYGTVMLVGNTYTLAAGITLNAVTDLVIQGPGLITTAQDIVELTLTSCERIMIRDVSFVSTKAAPATATAISCNECLSIWIESCYFNGHLTGIYAYDSTDQHEIYVSNCLVQTTDLAGSIGIKLDSYDNYVSGNIIRGYETGIWCGKSAQQIQGNHVYKSPSATYNYSIDIDPSALPAGTNVTLLDITGNYLDNPDVTCIRFVDTEKSIGINISDNIFLLDTTPTATFITLAGGTYLTYTTVRHNIFRKLGAALATSIDPGAVTLGATVQISKNIFSNCQQFATAEYIYVYENTTLFPLVVSALPAAGAAFDYCGIKFQHASDAGTVVYSGDMTYTLIDPTDGAEYVDTRFDVNSNGSVVEIARLRGGGDGAATKGLRIGTAATGGGDWNGPHLQMGNSHFWVFNNKLYYKASAPTAEDDGTVIGP